MLWEPGKDPTFRAWPGAPKYRVTPLSTLLEDPEAIIDAKTYARIAVDLDVTYEEANFLKELFERELNAREVNLQVAKTDAHGAIPDGDINFESVDTIVISHLQSIESNTIDRQQLIQIYQSI